MSLVLLLNSASFLNVNDFIVGLSTETVTVTATSKEATRTTSVSRRESTTTEFIRMITSDTSSLIVTQSTPYIIQELLSTTNENVVTATSTVMTETSTQTITGMVYFDTYSSFSKKEIKMMMNNVQLDTKSNDKSGFSMMKILVLSNCYIYQHVKHRQQ